MIVFSGNANIPLAKEISSLLEGDDEQDPFNIFDCES
jgi:hypothetical protein